MPIKKETSNPKTCNPSHRSSEVATSSLKFKNRSTRKRAEKDVAKAVSYMQTTTVCPPLICDEHGTVLCGEIWLAAARIAGREQISILTVNGLTAAQKIAIEIGYNKILEMEGWDDENLKAQVQAIYEFDTEFNFEALGFHSAETDILIFSGFEEFPENEIEEVREGTIAVSRLGDKWKLGPHGLLNGSATDPASYHELIGEYIVRTVFCDPPYNVKTKGHIGGGGKIKHREFVEAAGEMSVQEFTQFLTNFLINASAYLLDGAVLYICMDFRHMREVLDAARNAGLAMLNLCVWCKNNGGMGSFYRSQHELVFVFKKGDISHVNNIELGKHGRYRTNVWNYEGVNTFKTGRMDELSMHPTVKPASMVADAILDSSKRGEYILDPFAGSGTIFIACEKTGRKGLGIELDPLYVDVAIRRWEKFTGLEAIHEASGETFKEREKYSCQRVPPALAAPRSRDRNARKGGKNV